MSRLPGSHVLKIRQQPRHSRMCGFGDKVDRRPVDPPPIIQMLYVPTDGSSPDSLFNHAPNFFLYASLIGDDSDEEFHLLRDGKTRSTAGSIVSSLFRLKDTTLQEGAFFVFPDLSIRREGNYRFKFSLFEIVDAEIFYCVSVISESFSVFTGKKFPGMGESTALSKTFADQGVKIRIRREIRSIRPGTDLSGEYGDDQDEDSASPFKDDGPNGKRQRIEGPPQQLYAPPYPQQHARPYPPQYAHDPYYMHQQSYPSGPAYDLQHAYPRPPMKMPPALDEKGEPLDGAALPKQYQHDPYFYPYGMPPNYNGQRRQPPPAFLPMKTEGIDPSQLPMRRLPSRPENPASEGVPFVLPRPMTTGSTTLGEDTAAVTESPTQIDETSMSLPNIPSAPAPLNRSSAPQGQPARPPHPNFADGYYYAPQQHPMYQQNPYYRGGYAPGPPGAPQGYPSYPGGPPSAHASYPGGGAQHGHGGQPYHYPPSYQPQSYYGGQQGGHGPSHYRPPYPGHLQQQYTDYSHVRPGSYPPPVQGGSMLANVNPPQFDPYGAPAANRSLLPTSQAPIPLSRGAESGVFGNEESETTDFAVESTVDSVNLTSQVDSANAEELEQNLDLDELEDGGEPGDDYQEGVEEFEEDD